MQPTSETHKNNGISAPYLTALEKYGYCNNVACNPQRSVQTWMNLEKKKMRVLFELYIGKFKRHYQENGKFR